MRTETLIRPEHPKHTTSYVFSKTRSFHHSHCGRPCQQFCLGCDNRLGDGPVDGFNNWTDSVDEAGSVGGTTTANSVDPGAVTTPHGAPSVTVSWSSSGNWQAGAETNAEQGLYRVYLDDGGSGPTVTVSGLSTWLSNNGATGYKVTFYRATDATANTFAEMNIYQGAGTGGFLLDSIAPELAAGDGAYPTSTGGGGSRHKQTALGTFTDDIVTFHTDRDLGGGGRAGLAGFRIDSIPEPSSSILIAFGILSCILRRRR